MTENKSIFDPEVLLPKLKPAKEVVVKVIKSRKKLFIVIAVLLILISIYSIKIKGPSKPQAVKPKTESTQVDKSFEFPALNNQGKVTNFKIKMKITNAERTDQVMVKDQNYTAKNNKLFLIVNLELKNDATQPLNILPGDLIRLSYNSDEDNKYAPDLHNNLVATAAISTRIDRVGFVIPDNIKSFKLFVGELEGKKESITVNF